MAINKDIFASIGSNQKDILLGQEPVDRKTGLTPDKKKEIFESLRGDFGTTVTRGRIPKAYERILGEGNYHPEFGYERTQELLAEQQSGFGQFANAMNQAILGEVVGGTLEGVGYLGRILDIGSMVNGTEDDWGNWLSDIGRDLKTWTREVSPVYSDAKAFDPGNWSWWMTNVPSIFSSVSLFLPAAGVVRGVGMLGKAMNIGTKLGKTAQWMATGIGQAVVSRHMENMMEAAGVFEEAEINARMKLSETYLPQMEAEVNALPLSMPFDPEFPGGYTEEDKRRDIQNIQRKYETIVAEKAKGIASLAASNTYRKQWVLLMQDVPQYLLFNKIGGMGPGAKEGSTDVLKRMGVDPFSLYGKKSAGIFKDMLGEAGEEMFQFVVNEQSKALMKSASDPAIKNSLISVLKDNFDNGEMWTAATFGFLGAGAMQSAFAGINAKAIRKSNEARIADINRFGPSYAHAAAIFNDAVESGDPVKKDIAVDNLVASLGISAKEHNNIQHLKSFIKAMKDPSDNTLETFNITENERFLADNPDVADRILKNIDEIDVLYDRFVKEGEANKNVKPGDVNKFARNMTINRFLIDRANERVAKGKERIDASDKVADFNKLSPQNQNLKYKKFTADAIKESIAKFEKLAKNEKGLASPDQIATYNNIIAQKQLALGFVNEEISVANKALETRSEEELRDDEIYDVLDNDQVKAYVSDLLSIENTEAAVQQAEDEIKQFREGKGYVATPKEKDEYEAGKDLPIEEYEGITPGDKISFIDDAGNERLGEVDYISVAEFDSEGNPVEPDSENADNMFIVRTFDENGNLSSTSIALSGDRVTLVASKDVAEKVADVEEGLSFEEEEEIGWSTAYARNVENTRGSLEPVSNLSYSHVDETDPRVIEIRNDKLNEVISDPNTSLKDARAYYYLDASVVNEYIDTLSARVKELKKNITSVKEGTDTYKELNNRITKFERQVELVTKLKDVGSLTKKDKFDLTAFNTGLAYEDIGDQLPISVRIVINGIAYTKGLFLHTSSYDRIRLPSSVRRRNDPKEIEKEKNKKKDSSRRIRVAILKELINGNEPFSDNLIIGRGAPRTINKNLPANKRVVDPIELFGITDTNGALLAIATTTLDRKGGYYEPELKTGATTKEHDISNISSVGSAYLITDNTINGKKYAYKLNNKPISSEHAELIWDSFILLARSNITRSITEKEKKKGAIGRYDLKFSKEETRVAGLSIGELIDLLVVHGEHLTDPDSPRYVKADLGENHAEILRNKKLYLTLSPDKKAIPYLVFGVQDETTGRPYQVDLRSEGEIRANKDIFVKWMTENKTYAKHLVNKMLGLELNSGSFLSNRKFRVGEKGSSGMFNREPGENYNTFLLNHIVTADAEKGENGLAFHAPTVDLNLISSKDGSVNLMKKGDRRESVTKPEVQVKDEKIKESLQTEQQKQEEKVEPLEKKTRPVTEEEIKQFAEKNLEFIEFLEGLKKLGKTFDEVYGNWPKYIAENNPVKSLRDSGLTDKEVDNHPDFIEWKRQNNLFEYVTSIWNAEKNNIGETIQTAIDTIRQEILDYSLKEKRIFEREVPKVKKEELKLPLDDSVEDIMNDFEDDGSLYTRRRGTFTKVQDIHKELAWVAKKVGITKNQVEFTTRLNDLMRDGIHNWAIYGHKSTLLLEAAETGTLYHEAFHRVSIGYLTIEERRKMYRTARQVYKMPERMFTEVQVEEKLAEEFREYVVLREQNVPSGIRKIFQDIIDFFSALFLSKNRLNHSDVDAMFKGIYRGDFRWAKIAVGNQTNAGSQRYYRQIKNIEFNSIVTRKQQKDLVKNLAARLFTLSVGEESEQNAADLNNIGDIDWKLLEKDLESKLVRLNNIIESKTTSDAEKDTAINIRLMFSEVLGPKDEIGQYINFPIFVDLIEDYFNFLGVKYKHNKESDQLDSGLNGEEITNRGDSDYARASYEISSKDNALSSIKFMVSTLHSSDQIDPVTNFRPFVEFQEIWHRLLFDLHDHLTIEEMIETLYSVGEKLDYHPYKQLAKKLEKAKINTQIQFFTSLRMHRHEFVNFMFTYGSKGAKFNVEDASYEELSRNSALRWNENIRVDENISTINKKGERETNEKFFEDIVEENFNTKVYLLDSIDEKVVDQEVIDKVINNTISVLGKMHIVVDRITMDWYIDTFDNETMEGRLISMLGEVEKLLSEKTLNENLINHPVAKDLSKSWASAHPEQANDITLGPEDHKYYSYAPHSLATDITNKINKDKAWVEEKRSRIYNKHSLILNNLLSDEEARKNFSVVTFSKLAANTRGDLGRDFVSVTSLEDYLIKQAALFDVNGLLPFPVMPNRKTYFFMKGGIKPLETVISSSTADNNVMFTDEVVDIFYGYYKDEAERVTAVKKTIAEYEAAEGEIKDRLQARLIKNLHYADNFNTKEANGIHFIHFKGFKVGMSKQEFTEKLQITLNDRLKEEVEYADEIGVVGFDRERNAIHRRAMSAVIAEKFINEEMPVNHEMLHALSHNMINQIIAVMESEKIFMADPAQFGRTKNTDIDVFEDLYKRWFGVGSSGTKLVETIDNETSDYSVATFKDQKFKSDYYDRIHAKHVDLYTKSLTKKGVENPEIVAEKLATRRLTAYEDVDPTDGGMLISPAMYKKVSRRLGRWSDQKETAFNLLQSDKKLSYNQELESLNIVLNPYKTVYIGHHNHDNIDLLIYDKMSMATIFRRNVKGSYLEDVLDRMEAKGKYQGLPLIDAIKFESVVKVGGMRAQNMFEDAQSRNKLTDFSTLDIYKQTFDNLKHQLETDVHDSDRQTFGTQAFKSLTSDIQKDQPYGDFKTGQELIDSVVKTRVALSKLGVDRVGAKLGIRGNRIDNSKLVNMLKIDAKLAGKPQDFIDALKVDNETGEMFLELDSFSDRRWVYSKIMSIINKETVDLSLPGNQLIQVSDYGMNSKEDQVGVRGTKELGFSYSNTGSKEVYEMEARVPVRLFKNFIPNYDTITYKEKLAFVNSDLMALGYRIPTEGQNSIVKLKIVDLLDEQAGDVIYLPLEFTALTGSDFDIDKLFVITYNYRYDRKTKTLNKIPFNSDDSKKGLETRYERKALELYSIYRNSTDVFDIETQKELSGLFVEKEEVKEGKRSLYQNEGRLIKNEKAKLDIIRRREERAESEEEKVKWGEMATEMQENIDYMYFITDINRDIYNNISDQTASMLYRRISGKLVDAGILPTKEEFSKLSIEEQNTKLANENRLLDMFFTVLADEKHYLLTSTPLGMLTDRLKRKAERFQSISRGKKDRSLPSLKMGTPSFQTQTKSTFVGSDAGIGPSALNNAHHGLTQHAGLKLKSTLGFEFNKNNELALDRIEGEDGIHITSWLSTLIDAHVDAVKDPYIMGLNVNEITLNPLTFMLRVGVGEVAFDYLSQPIIKQYAKEKLNELGVISNIPDVETLEKDKTMVMIMEAWKAAYLSKGGKEEDLEDNAFYFPLNEILKTSVLQDDIDFKVKKDKDYYRRQLSALHRFAAIQDDSDQLKRLVMASRIDTKKYGSIPSELNVFISRIKQIEESGKWINLEKLLNSEGRYVEGGTMLSSLLKNSVLYIREALSRKSIYGTPGFNSILFDSILYSTTAGNKSSSGTIRTITEELMSSLLGRFFSDFDIGPGLTTNKVINLIHDPKYSVFTMLNEIKKGVYPNSEYLKANPFIKALIIDYTEADEVLLKQSLKLPFRTLNDLWETDDYIEAFSELMYHPEITVRNVAKSLYYYSFYSSGFRNRLYSFSSYLPSESQREIEVKDPKNPSETKKVGLNNFVKKLLKDLVDDSSTTEYALRARKEVFTNNWWNPNLVPVVGYSMVESEIKDGTGYVAGYEIDLDTLSDEYLGKNEEGSHMFSPYLLLEMGDGTSVLLEYMGYNTDGVVPVYMIIPKKGFQAKGLVFKEYGLRNLDASGKEMADKSVLFQNNPEKLMSREQVNNYIKSAIPTYFAIDTDNQLVSDRNPSKDFFIEDEAAEMRSLERESRIVGFGGFKNYKGGFENVGKGTPQGDGKDKAMREVADSFIGEIEGLKSKFDKEGVYLSKVSTSSTQTSYNEIQKKGEVGTSWGYSIGASTHTATVESKEPKVVMLARNSIFKGKPLEFYTKAMIDQLIEQGVEFVVGDMPGVDSQFINYLQEIGAKFTIYHTGKESRIQVKDVNKQITKSGSGINIYSKSVDPLGRDLTNPSYAKNGKSEFDIEPTNNLIKPEDFILPNIPLFKWAINRFGENVTAKDAWGHSVEAWYFANKKESLEENVDFISTLIQIKLNTYPELIKQIKDRGGVSFLLNSEHTVSGNKNWEGKGFNSNFIRALIKAYTNITNEIVEVIKPITIQTTLQFEEDQSTSTSLSSPNNPIEIFVDGSVKPAQLGIPKANIPQNLVSGVEAYGIKQIAKEEVKEKLGDAPHSIDMVESGFRTRTTRSVSEMEKYNIKVGDVVNQFGKSADGTTKNILTRITAIHKKGTPGFSGTWNKEGWTMEGVESIKRYKEGAAAIEFTIVKPDELEYGYGAWTNFGGKPSGISGANAKVEELLFSEFPELKGQDQANPSVELLATLEVLKSFQTTAEHLLILQDNNGIVNYQGLRERSILNEGNSILVGNIRQAKTIWIPNRKGDTPHIKYLVNEIIRVTEEIERNGGSVTFKWIPGHLKINTAAKVLKYPEVFKGKDGTISANLIENYILGNDNADIAAKSTTEKIVGLFANPVAINESGLNSLKFSNEQIEEGKDNIQKCKE